MTIKLIEVRDSMTCMVMAAVRLDANEFLRDTALAFAGVPGFSSPASTENWQREVERQRWLLSRIGFGRTLEDQRQYILLWDLVAGASSYDPFDWGSSRTQPTVHHWLLADNGKNFDTLQDGAVVDVRVILGEQDEAVESEQGAGWGR